MKSARCSRNRGIRPPGRLFKEASKAVGAQVSSDLHELVKLRNEAAQKLGFKNYHALQLYLNEQNGDEIIKASSTSWTL